MATIDLIVLGMLRKEALSAYDTSPLIICASSPIVQP